MRVAERIKARLADFQSKLFRELITDEKRSSREVAAAFTEVASDCLFEAIFIEGKILGKYPSSMRPEQAVRDPEIHRDIMEEMVQRSVRDMGRARPQFVWTAWICAKKKSP